MKIIKGAAKAEIHWTARQLVEYVEDGTVNFNIDRVVSETHPQNEKTLVAKL